MKAKKGSIAYTWEKVRPEKRSSHHSHTPTGRKNRQTDPLDYESDVSYKYKKFLRGLGA